ncbi:MAG TPA: xanthine dehydrogenase family protein molybdopterin-binding subunit, partial [Beijerinckiaceae bacterium]|nr:xanthine dehydrogenase family protein molybdopterin-binding subunit [Beijerinckiaceae bacterium]
MSRIEDARLVTGQGCFVGDLLPEGCLVLEFVRSQAASGRLKSVEAGEARALRGVAAVLTADDLPSREPLAINPLVPGIAAPPAALLA